MGYLALEKQELIRFITNLKNIGEMSNEDLEDIYDCNIKFADQSIDGNIYGYSGEISKWIICLDTNKCINVILFKYKIIINYKLLIYYLVVNFLIYNYQQTENK